jgi:Ser/Thr protein kinase RdoA (MazF antagonist)
MTVPSTSIRPADPRVQGLVAAIASQFSIEGSFILGEEIDSGHINSTYRVTFLRQDAGQERYILQSINRVVFKDPYAVMSNVETVTRHIQSRVAQLNQDRPGRTLNLVPARGGGTWIEDGQGAVWRCYHFIEGCVTYDVVANTRQAYQAARAFGAFQDLVSDLDASSLAETIPDFHHTRKRLERLLEAAAADAHHRLATARAEFDFIRRRESLTSLLVDLAAAGQLPTRVTHNDTKINNVMFGAASDEAVCVIDLDTVMPGLALHDFGDLVRSSTSPAAEDETDLSKVEMRMPVFQALVEGYFDAAGGFLTPAEVEYLVDAGKIMTLEVAIRFLTDYLEGDVYFKTQRPGQNLDRCRTQLKLVERIEEQEREMRVFVDKVRRGWRSHLAQTADPAAG